MIHKNDVDEMDTESSIEQTLLLCWTWLVQISINEKTQNALVYKLTHYGLYKDEKHSQSNDSILNLDFILNCFKQELGYNLTNKFSFNISNESIAECLAHHTETFFNRNSIIIQILYGLIYGILMYRDTGLTSIISQNAECPKQEVIQLDSHITYMEKTPCVNSQSPENESTSVIPIVVYVHPIKHRTVQSSPNRLLVKNQQSLQLLLLLQELVNLLSSLCASFNTLLPYAQQAIIISVIPWILSCVAHHRLLWNHPLIEGKLELILLHILSHIDSSSLFNNSNLTTVHSFCYTFLNCSPYETNPRLGELTRMGDGETILSWLATGEVVNQKVVVRLQTGASDKHNLNKCNNCLHSPCLFQKQSSCSHSLYDFSTGASLRVLLVVLIFIKSLAWSALDSGSLDNILCLSGPVSKKVTLGSDGTLHSGSAPTLSEDILFVRHLATQIALKIWFFQIDVSPSLAEQHDSFVFRIPLCFLLGKKLLSCLNNVSRIKHFSRILASLSSPCSFNVWNFLTVLWRTEYYNVRLAESFPLREKVMKTYGNLSCYEGHVLQWIRRSLQHSGENLKLLSTSIARQHSDSKFYQKAFSQTLSLTENDSKDVFFLLKDIYCHIKLSAILWTFRPLFEIVLWMVSPDTFNHLTCLSIQKSIKSAAEMFKWFVFDKNTTPNIHFATVSKFSTILDVVFSIEDYPDSTESSFNMNSLDEVSKKTEGIDSEKKTKNEQRKVYNNIKDTTNVTNNQIVQNNFDMKENSQSSFLTGPLLIEIGRQLVMTAFLYVTIQNQAAVGQVLYTVIKHWCFKHYSFSLFIIETNCFYSCKGTLSQGSMYNRDRPSKMTSSTLLRLTKDAASKDLLKHVEQSQNDENTFNQLVEYIDDYFTISTGLPTSLTTISVLTRSLSYFCVPSQEFLLYESSQLTIRGLYFYFKLEGFLQSIFYKKKHTGYSLNHSTCFTPYIIGKWLWDCISYQSSGNAANALNENSSTVSSTTTIQNFKQNKNPLQDSLSYHITSEERKKNSIFFESHSGRTIVHPLLTVLLHSMSSFLSLFLTESKCYVLSSTCLEWIEFTFFQLKLHILKNHNTEKENPTPAENIFSFTFDMDDISILEKWLTLIDIGDKNKRDVVQNVLLLSKKITKKIETYYATLCQKTLIGRLLIMSGVEPQMLLYGLNNEIETVPLDKTSNFTFGVYKRNNLQSGFPDMMSSMQPLLFPLLGRQILETNLCFSCPPFSKKELPVSNLLLWIIGQAFKTVFFSFPLLLHKNSTSELKFCDA